MNVKAMHDYCFRFACLKRTYRLRERTCALNSVDYLLYTYYAWYRDTALFVHTYIRLIKVSMET